MPKTRSSEQMGQIELDDYNDPKINAKRFVNQIKHALNAANFVPPMMDAAISDSDNADDIQPTTPFNVIDLDEQLLEQMLYAIAENIEETDELIEVVRLYTNKFSKNLPTVILVNLAKLLCKRENIEYSNKVYDHALELYHMAYENGPTSVQIAIQASAKPPTHLIQAISHLALRVKTSTRNSSWPKDARLLLNLINDYPTLLDANTTRDDVVPETKNILAALNTIWQNQGRLEENLPSHDFANPVSPNFSPDDDHINPLDMTSGHAATSYDSEYPQIIDRPKDTTAQVLDSYVKLLSSTASQDIVLAAINRPTIPLTETQWCAVAEGWLPEVGPQISLKEIHAHFSWPDDDDNYSETDDDSFESMDSDELQDLDESPVSSEQNNALLLTIYQHAAGIRESALLEHNRIIAKIQIQEKIGFHHWLSSIIQSQSASLPLIEAIAKNYVIPESIYNQAFEHYPRAAVILGKELLNNSQGDKDDLFSKARAAIQKAIETPKTPQINSERKQDYYLLAFELIHKAVSRTSGQITPIPDGKIQFNEPQNYFSALCDIVKAIPAVGNELENLRLSTSIQVIADYFANKFIKSEETRENRNKNKDEILKFALDLTDNDNILAATRLIRTLQYNDPRFIRDMCHWAVDSVTSQIRINRHTLLNVIVRDYLKQGGDVAAIVTEAVKVIAPSDDIGVENVIPATKRESIVRTMLSTLANTLETDAPRIQYLNELVNHYVHIDSTISNILHGFITRLTADLSHVISPEIRHTLLKNVIKLHRINPLLAQNLLETAFSVPDTDINIAMLDTTPEALFSIAAFACSLRLTRISTLLYREAFNKAPDLIRIQDTDSDSGNDGPVIVNQPLPPLPDQTPVAEPKPPEHFVGLLSYLSDPSWFNSTKDAALLTKLIFLYPMFGCEENVYNALNNAGRSQLRRRITDALSSGDPEIQNSAVIAYANIDEPAAIAHTIQTGGKAEFSFDHCLRAAEIMLTRAQAVLTFAPAQVPANTAAHQTSARSIPAVEALACRNAAIAFYRRAAELYRQADEAAQENHNPNPLPRNAIDNFNRVKDFFEQLILESTRADFTDLQAIRDISACYIGLEQCFENALRSRNNPVAVAIACYLPIPTTPRIIAQSIHALKQNNMPEPLCVLIHRGAISNFETLARPLGGDAKSADYLSALSNVVQLVITKGNGLNEATIQRVANKLVEKVDNIADILELAKTAIDDLTHEPPFVEAKRLLNAAFIRQPIPEDLWLSNLLNIATYWAAERDSYEGFQQDIFNQRIAFIDSVVASRLNDQGIKNALFRHALTEIASGHDRLARHLLGLALQTEPQPNIAYTQINNDIERDRWIGFIQSLEAETETGPNATLSATHKAIYITSLLKAKPRLIFSPLTRTAHADMALSKVLRLPDSIKAQTLDEITQRYLELYPGTVSTFYLAEAICHISPTNPITQAKAIALYRQAFGQQAIDLNVAVPSVPPRHIRELLRLLARQIKCASYPNANEDRDVLVNLLNRYPTLDLGFGLDEEARNSLKNTLVTAITRNTQALAHPASTLVGRAHIAVIASLCNPDELAALAHDENTPYTSDQWRWLAEILLEQNDIDNVAHADCEAPDGILVKVYQRAAKALPRDARPTASIQRTLSAQALLISAVNGHRLDLVQSITANYTDLAQVQINVDGHMLIEEPEADAPPAYSQGLLVFAVNSADMSPANKNVSIAIISHLASLTQASQPVFNTNERHIAYHMAQNNGNFEAAIAIVKHLPNDTREAIAALLAKVETIRTLPSTTEEHWQLINALITHASASDLAQSQSTNYDAYIVTADPAQRRGDLTLISANHLLGIWRTAIQIPADESGATKTARHALIKTLLQQYPQIFNEEMNPDGHQEKTLIHVICNYALGRIEFETVEAVINRLKDIKDNDAARKNIVDAARAQIVNVQSGPYGATALHYALNASLFNIAHELLTIDEIDVEKANTPTPPYDGSLLCEPLTVVEFALTKVISATSDDEFENAYTTLLQVIKQLPEQQNDMAKQKTRINVAMELLRQYWLQHANKSSATIRYAYIFATLWPKIDRSNFFTVFFEEGNKLPNIICITQELEAAGYGNKSKAIYDALLALPELNQRITDELAAGSGSFDQAAWIATYQTTLLGNTGKAPGLLAKAIESGREDIALNLIARFSQASTVNDFLQPLYNPVDYSGTRPSHLAATQGMQTVLERLQNHDPACFDQPDGKGLSVLDHAILGAAELRANNEDPERLSLIQWLTKQQGVPTALQQKNADQALLFAIPRNHIDLANYLINYHPSVNIYGVSVDGLLRAAHAALDFSTDPRFNPQEQQAYLALAKNCFRLLFQRLAQQTLSPESLQLLDATTASTQVESLLRTAITQGELDLASALIYLYPSLLDKPHTSGKMIRDLASYHGHANALGIQSIQAIQAVPTGATLLTAAAPMNLARAQALQALQGVQTTLNTKLSRNDIKAIFTKLHPVFPDAIIEKGPLKVQEDTANKFSCEATYTVKPHHDPSDSKQVTLTATLRPNTSTNPTTSATVNRQEQLNVRVSGQHAHSEAAHAIMATWIRDQQIATLKKDKVTKNGQVIPNSTCNSKQIADLRANAFIGVCTKLNDYQNDVELASMVLALAREGVYTVLSKAECSAIVAAWGSLEPAKFAELQTLRQQQEQAYLNFATNKHFQHAPHLISHIINARAKANINIKEDTAAWLQHTSPIHTPGP